MYYSLNCMIVFPVVPNKEANNLFAFYLYGYQKKSF